MNEWVLDPLLPLSSLHLKIVCVIRFFFQLFISLWIKHKLRQWDFFLCHVNHRRRCQHVMINFLPFFLLYQRFYCWLLSYIFLIQFNYCLQRFIGTRSQSEIDALVSAKTGGCSPLLIACRNGHYDVVQYLLKRCHADVEQCGSVIFDGETIENAPPLW